METDIETRDKCNSIVALLKVTPPLRHLQTWRNSTPYFHLRVGAKLHMIYASRVNLRLFMRLGYIGVTLTPPSCKWPQKSSYPVINPDRKTKLSSSGYKPIYGFP